MVKYSVVICAFNEEKHIEKCFRSIINQNVDNDLYEIIISDNSSEDNTFEIANSIIDDDYSGPKVKLLKIKHVDLSTSRNTALKHANGRYIAFIDADATADENWLKEIDSVINDSDESVSVYSGSVQNLSTENIVSDFIYTSHVKSVIDTTSGSKLIGANMVFKREVFDDVLFLKGMRRGDETSLLARYKKINPNCKEFHIEKAIVYNDYPDKIFSWLKVLYVEGQMRYIIDNKIIDTPPVKLILNTIFRALFIASFFIVLASLLFDFIPSVALIASFGLIIARLFRVKRYFLFGFLNAYSSKYKLLSPLSFIVGLVFFVCRDLGVIKSSFIQYINDFKLSEEVSSVLLTKVAK